jgi:hypothetical protein
MAFSPLLFQPTEMAKVAEELAILLRATPSEANTVKAHGLYQQLSSYYIQEVSNFPSCCTGVVILSRPCLVL